MRSFISEVLVSSSIKYFLSVQLFFFFITCQGQSPVTISEPQLKLTDNVVSIHYDILNSNRNDRFDISLEVTDSEGKHFTAKALSGDIGEKISGGSGKEISWNLTADNVYLKAMLYFQVSAKITTAEKNAADGKSTESTERLKGSGNLSRSDVVFQSLLMPGLGLSRLNDGQPHWIRGVVGYSCLASSAAFYTSSRIKYNEYQQATNLTERDNLFEASTNQKNISGILLYSSIGVWVVDFIWTIAGSKELSKNLAHSLPKGFSIQPLFDTRENFPLLALKYNF